MGEIISASDALEIGLVNRVAAAGRAVDDAMTMAETIAERGPLAVREAKQVLDLAGDMPLDEGMARELDASERIFASRDMLEGAQAFFEKRPPRFTGE
jgi:enoyl-CoA hydratase/carnithine racemase